MPLTVRGDSNRFNYRIKKKKKNFPHFKLHNLILVMIQKEKNKESLSLNKLNQERQRTTKSDSTSPPASETEEKFKKKKTFPYSVMAPLKRRTKVPLQWCSSKFNAISSLSLSFLLRSRSLSLTLYDPIFWILYVSSKCVL